MLGDLPLTFQVEALQEGIARLRSDIKEAKGRGEEKERQQREQVIIQKESQGKIGSTE